MHGEQQRRAVQERDREHVERIVEEIAVIEEKLFVQSRCGKIPNGTASLQLPISSGRMKPSDEIEQDRGGERPGDMRAHAEHARARHRPAPTTAISTRQEEAGHQPPAAFLQAAEMVRPCCGSGGSSASHGSWRTNSIGLQFTDAIMLSPMISIAMKPHISEATPGHPR